MLTIFRRARHQSSGNRGGAPNELVESQQTRTAAGERLAAHTNCASAILNVMEAAVRFANASSPIGLLKSRRAGFGATWSSAKRWPIQPRARWEDQSVNERTPIASSRPRFESRLDENPERRDHRRGEQACQVNRVVASDFNYRLQLPQNRPGNRPNLPQPTARLIIRTSTRCSEPIPRRSANMPTCAGLFRTSRAATSSLSSDHWPFRGWPSEPAAPDPAALLRCRRFRSKVHRRRGLLHNLDHSLVVRPGHSWH